MRAASQLSGRGGGGVLLMWMLPLYLHVNQKSDYDDDMMTRHPLYWKWTGLKSDC